MSKFGGHDFTKLAREIDDAHPSLLLERGSIRVEKTMMQFVRLGATIRQAVPTASKKRDPSISGSNLTLCHKYGLLAGSKAREVCLSKKGKHFVDWVIAGRPDTTPEPKLKPVIEVVSAPPARPAPTQAASDFSGVKTMATEAMRRLVADAQAFGTSIDRLWIALQHEYIQLKNRELQELKARLTPNDDPDLKELIRELDTPPKRYGEADAIPAGLIPIGEYVELKGLPEVDVSMRSRIASAIKTLYEQIHFVAPPRYRTPGTTNTPNYYPISFLDRWYLDTKERIATTTPQRMTSGQPRERIKAEERAFYEQKALKEKVGLFQEPVVQMTTEQQDTTDEDGLDAINAFFGFKKEETCEQRP